MITHDTLILSIALVALVLSTVEEFRAGGRSLLAFAVMALAMIPVVNRL